MAAVAIETLSRALAPGCSSGRTRSKPGPPAPVARDIPRCPAPRGLTPNLLPLVLLKKGEGCTGVPVLLCPPSPKLPATTRPQKAFNHQLLEAGVCMRSPSLVRRKQSAKANKAERLAEPPGFGETLSNLSQGAHQQEGNVLTM